VGHGDRAVKVLVARRAVRRSIAAVATLLLLAQAHAAPVEVRVTGADGRPLADAVVYLESNDARVESNDARGKAKPLPLAEIAQVDKQFVPAVSVVTVGTPVGFPNRDTVRHHVYSFSDIKRFELKLYVGTPEAPVIFDKPGIAVLGCNIHDNMAAWVVVVDTPWHGRTGSDGRWAAPDVPPGSYRLRTWHALLGEAQPGNQPLRVEATGASAAVKLAGETR
jgi:plastocyanin